MQADYPGFAEFAEGDVPPERLADRLVNGRLPLDQALGCAADLALALRDLHASGRAHGSVTPVFVGLEPSRAVLLPAPGSAPTASQAGDVAAFGAVLYEMLLGRKPAPGAFDPASLRSYPEPWTPAHQSALRVVEKCLAVDSHTLPDLRNIATEIRLLLVIARRPGTPASALRRTEMPGALPPSKRAVDSDDSAVTLTDLVCPCCGADDVHLSAQRPGFERLLGRFDVSFFRCHRCFHRFMIVFGIRIKVL